MEIVKSFFGNWPFWLPILTFLLGHSTAKFASLEETKARLDRLSTKIAFPKEWKTGEVRVELDGRSLTRTSQATAALLVRNSRGHGSGVAISSAGLILTNQHVVSDEKVVEIEGDGFSILGRVVKADTKRDVALIKVDSAIQPVAAVSQKMPSAGDDILVAGAPYHTENKQLVTRGVISKVAELEGESYLYTDASIAPGNSGGPVFSAEGELVGITTAIQIRNGAQTHIGMVIPIDVALDCLNIVDAKRGRRPPAP